MTPLDPVVKDLLALIAAAKLPAFSDCTPEEAREMLRARRAARPAPPKPEIGSTEDVTVPGPGGGLRARLYRPKGASKGTIVYFHGGGWVVGELESVDAGATILVDVSGWSVLSVDYRLAPEHPFPAALDDSYASLEWANDQFGGPLILAGDSAGGNLATAAVLRSLQSGGPKVVGQILLYPVTDHDFETPSYKENGELGYMISTTDMRWFWDRYTTAEQRLDPLASPLRAQDLSKMPPAFVVVAGYDPLRDEGIAYAEKLEAAGVPVVLRRYDSMIHGFASMIGVVAQAEEVMRDAGAWVAALKA